MTYKLSPLVITNDGEATWDCDFVLAIKDVVGGFGDVCLKVNMIRQFVCSNNILSPFTILMPLYWLVFGFFSNFKAKYSISMKYDILMQSYSYLALIVILLVNLISNVCIYSGTFFLFLW